MSPKAAFVFAAIAVMACARSATQPAEARNPPPQASEGEAAAPEQGPAVAEVEAAEVTSSGPIGVPECDEYVRLFEKCLEEKLPAHVKAQSRIALDQTVEAWREAAASEAGRADLAEECIRAREPIAASCGW